MRRICLVQGSSMYPALRDGDLVLLGRPRWPLVPGDVVVYRRHGDGGLVVHRVAAVSGGQLLTQGDANGRLDPLPVATEQLEGRVLCRVPWLGRLLAMLRRGGC